jgi:WD40 repeat protein
MKGSSAAGGEAESDRPDELADQGAPLDPSARSQAVAVAVPLPPGARIGRYSVEALLGLGAFGAVYRARDTLLERSVALKVLAAPDRSAATAALAEARAAATLQHPGIVAVHDAGWDEGLAYIAMEEVAGATLTARLAEGPLPLEETLRLGVALAAALAYAHQRGVVHGDLAPANVLLAPTGPKLADFGLARVAATPGEQAGGGTRGYAAPEVLRGAAPTPAADLYALGAVLRAALGGSPPDATDARGPLLSSRSGVVVPGAVEGILVRSLDPDPLLRQGSAAILAEELARALEAVARPQSAASIRELPPGPAFRGLAAFHEADRQAFFGREAEVAAVVAMVTHADFRFGVLFGDSGSGKTSLVQAGMMPALREAGCLTVVTRAYAEPVAALTREAARHCGLALTPAAERDEAPHRFFQRIARRLGSPVVLILDQLEELAQLPREADREPLLTLAEACAADSRGDVRMLVVVRSDFLHRVALTFDGRVPEPLASARRHHLEPFAEDQAAAVIRRSAQHAGLPLEETLVRELAADLATAGQVLPTELQILGELVQRRRLLSLDAYRRAGGKEALLSDYLEEVIAVSGDDEGARLLLRALISEEGTRQGRTAEELGRCLGGRGERVFQLLGHFADARLVRAVPDLEPVRYELVHEYLIGPIERATGKVLDASQRAARLLAHHLSQHALDPAARIPLTRLRFLRRWAPGQERVEVRRLFAASLRAGLRRGLLAAGAMALAAGGLAAAFSVREEWREHRLAEDHTAAARHAALAPDGRTLATAGEDGRLLLWDLPTRRLLAAFSGDAEGDGAPSALHAVAFSPQGRWIASGGAGGEVVVWNRRARHEVRRLAVAGSVQSLGFSPDGGRLLAGRRQSGREWSLAWATEGWSELWNVDGLLPLGGVTFLDRGRGVLLRDGSRLLEVEDGPRSAPYLPAECSGSAFAVAPGGHLVASIDGQAFVRFCSPSQQRVLAQHRAHRDHGRAVAFSPDGMLLASGADDIVLWDAHRLEPLRRLAYPAIVWSLLFTPTGEHLVSTHGDGAVLLWAVADGRLEARLGGHVGSVHAVVFSPDGRRLASAGDDRSVIVWDIRRGGKEEVFAGHETRVNGLAFAPGGGALFSCDQDGELRRWDLAAGGQHMASGNSERAPCYHVTVPPGGRSVSAGQYLWTERLEPVKDLRVSHAGARVVVGALYAVAFTPDERRVVLGTDAGELMLLDLGSQATPPLVRRVEQNVIDLALSASLGVVASGHFDGAVHLWRLPGLEPLGELGRHAARVQALAVSPDGRRLATAGDDRTVVLWDLARRRRLGTVGEHTAPVRAVAFSPDGSRLAAGAQDGTVRLYTLERTLWGRRLPGRSHW